MERNQDAFLQGVRDAKSDKAPRVTVLSTGRYSFRYETPSYWTKEEELSYASSYCRGWAFGCES